MTHAIAWLFVPLLRLLAPASGRTQEGRAT